MSTLLPDTRIATVAKPPLTALRHPRLHWWLVVLVPGLLTLGLGCYQLSLPNVLAGMHDYGDGVYLGAALRLVHGLLPYRDFVMVHPPGIALLLAPVAALGDVFGTRDAMAIARVLTVLVTAANASLVAVAVRHRGKAAMLIAGLVLACFPMLPTADETLRLEPFLTCFCLIGLILMFSGGRLASNRRLLLAGVVFGVACSVKIWAGLPVIVAVAVCLPHWRRALPRFVPGLIAGFAVPCLPFFLAAPHSFVREVIVDQLGRVDGPGALPLGQRLIEITGLSALSILHATPALAWGVVLAFGLFVAVVYGLSARSTVTADWFVLGAAVVVTVGVLSSNEFWIYYPYFPAVFLAMLLGITCGLLPGLASRARRRLRSSSLRVLAIGAVVAAAAITVLLVEQQASYARSYLAPNGGQLSSATDPAPTLDRLIPSGSCVVTDEVSFAVLADRFNSTDPHCPPTVDPYGVWLDALPTHLPPYSGPYPASFVAGWGGWLSRANFVVEVAPNSDFIPWSPALMRWFASDFRLIYTSPQFVVYRRTATLAPPGATSAVTGAAHANALIAAGLRAERAGALDQALVDYRAAARKMPTDKWLPYDIGTVYQLSGDSGAAIAAYRRAVALDPSFTGALFNLGTVYQKLGDGAKAASAYGRVLQVDPRYASALYNLGVLLAPSEPGEAIRYYERDLAIHPADASANFNVGVLLVRRGDTARGDARLETALRIDPALRSDLPHGITVPAAPGH